jgi:hypothetical protein
MATKTLQTKQTSGGVDYYGPGTGYVAPETLYRYVDQSGRGGCWYSTIERAERSWQLRHS